ncbi:MAG: peptidyl-prolyl cis-trans isomerase [Bauldia sp.]|nr:peptidyl-prolyl cis-trans isomerase [Bauldia sp.]
MAWLRRLIGEPLVQFLVIGVLLFAGYQFLRGREVADNAPETIVVSEGRLAQIAEIFARTWQRPPTADELRSMVDTFVREEIYYREGRKIGLDQDDTVLRRRIQQKMEFVLEPSPEELMPADGVLDAYLATHRDAYRLPARVAFTQVYFDPDRPGAEAEADEALVLLRGNDPPAPDTLGDRTMLPAAMPLTSSVRIAGTIGPEFAAAIENAPVGEWTGPIRSAFGWHVVHVNEREPARDPTLEEVVDIVRRDWEQQRRQEIASARYAELLSRYTIVVAPLPDLKAAAVPPKGTTQ